jgi:AcrR family transcriptional regulator
MKELLLHRKDRLIITTIEIIDDLGIQGLTTKEIAKREGVSEATLFRHYKSKNDLLIAVLDYFTQFDTDIYQSTQLKGLKPKEAITFLVSSTVEYYENYPAITAIMMVMDVLRYELDLSDRVIKIVNNHNEYIKRLVEEAQHSGELHSDMNSEYLSEQIIGLCREICLNWRIKSKQFSLKERTLSSLKMLLDAFSN